ncbi:MAG: arginase [Chloroflexi bacterium]|nr:MAG: arginase [Chloroflexota bacterium]
MPTTTANDLRVIPIRYGGSRPYEADEDPVDHYAASGAFQLLGGNVTVSEPRFPEERRSADASDNLGIIGGVIADLVAEGRRAGERILVVGGDCGHVPGVVSGLQQAHGPAARIGLVWFDAHGDFNTPRTTLSGMLGGMPVAVVAGLAWPNWRELAKLPAPMPTDRIVMVDVRNLDAPEETLIRATDIVIAAPAPGFPGEDLQAAIDALAARCDYLYLHIDSDILDERYVPNHGTKEPNGPSMEQVLAAVDTVMDTGKVIAFALVSVWGNGEGGDVALRSGVELLRGSMERWQRHGTVAPA